MLLECWKVLCQLAPWLLLGMLLSGLLHVLLPAGFVRRKFHGLSGVIKAVLLGVPLPLCSCGVVPAGIGLKNQGASDGASVGFLISTPQTGIDSILVSASFFGWPFAIFKMVTAAITGVAGGVIADKVQSEQVKPDVPHHDHHDDSDQAAWLRVWNHGVEIVRSIWGWLLIGIIISAAIQVLIPQSVFTTIGQWGLVPAMILVLVVSTPLYVCATASVPIAAALVASGLPPAAALVFLMAGPATNITTIGAIYGRFGWKTVCVYLVTIILGSMIFAWLFDWLLTATVAGVGSHAHDHNNWWSILSAVILTLMIASFAWNDLQRWMRSRIQKSPDSPHVTVSIEGMTCGGCVNKLEKAIEKNSGVESVVVELKTGSATIFGSPSLAEIAEIVERSGFKMLTKN